MTKKKSYSCQTSSKNRQKTPKLYNLTLNLRLNSKRSNKNKSRKHKKLLSSEISSKLNNNTLVILDVLTKAHQNTHNMNNHPIC